MDCPAIGSNCARCGKTGHYTKTCLSGSPTFPKNLKAEKPCMYNINIPNKTIVSSSIPSEDRISISYPNCLTPSVVGIKIINQKCHALVNTGSASNLIKLDFCKKLGLSVRPNNQQLFLADSQSNVKICGTCCVDINIAEFVHNSVEFKVVHNLCSDVILGIELLSKHSEIKIDYGGSLPALNVCALTAMKVEPPSLFAHLRADCKPIATKSRFYSKENRSFIRDEIKRLLDEGIIEPSNSPWRAQVVVVTQNDKRRMVVDYSETINKYTYLDAFPLPNLDALVNQIAKFRYYSKIDLCSAYHLVPLREEKKHFTAFEADGNLYQFNCISFGN